jgi:lipopolysaccharide biosynthesis regulator YciM
LVRTESPDLDDDITKSRQYIEVENYIELGEFSKATKLLKGMDEERATKLIAQIGWIQGEYQNVVQAYEKIYDDPKNLPMAWKEEEKLNFVRLAVAYNNLGRLRDLENLTKRYQRNLREDDKIVQAVNFLMKDQGSDIVQSTKDPKSLWESVNNSLSAYYDFANYYDDFVADRETDKRDKDIFNRRMRQMSAPPRY